MAGNIGGYLAKFQYNSSGSTYADVAGLNSVEWSGLACGSRETTTLADACRTFQPTISDPGEITVQGNYDPTDASQAFFWTNLVTSPQTTNKNYKIIYNNNTATTVLISGHITEYKPGPATVDETVSIEFKVKLSGFPTLTP